MKKARLILSASLLTIGTFSAMTFSSCSKDDKVCNTGYEGKNCDVEIRQEMIGTYNATDIDVSNNTPYAYTPVISKNASVTVINIANFGDFFSNTELVTSNVSKSGSVISFTIPAQKPDNVYQVTGNGSYNVTTKKLDIQYTLDNGVTSKNYTGTWTKQ